MKRYRGEPDAGRFKVEVLADGSGKWAGNECRFDTSEEADAYGQRLAMRWTAVRDWRVVEEAQP